MKIIPVIDLKDGMVVQAREGKRDQYRPLESALCKSSNIFEIIQTFETVFGFDTFYIADINAICQTGNNEDMINNALVHFPGLKFWIDQGHHQTEEKFKSIPDNYLTVIGSESYRNETILELQTFDKNFILSLDFSMSQEMGAASLFSCPELWPDNIIIMTLDRVGSHKGPDILKLSEFCSKYPAKNFIAAGGIRNQQDLIELKRLGVKGALIASSLHNMAISAEDLICFT